MNRHGWLVRLFLATCQIPAHQEESEKIIPEMHCGVIPVYSAIRSAAISHRPERLVHTVHHIRDIVCATSVDVPHRSC